MIQLWMLLLIVSWTAFCIILLFSGTYIRPESRLRLIIWKVSRHVLL